jgi:hypothetical protein
MKIYFSQVSEDDLDISGEDGLFRHRGSYYYHGIEIGTNAGGMDEFTIFDGCNRMVPLSVDSLDELIEGLQRVKEYLDRINQGKEAAEMLDSDKEECVAGWF